MSKYKALVTFSGAESMAMGEVKELSDQFIIADLLRAGYIIPVEDEKKPVKEKPAKAEKKAVKKKTANK